MVGIRRWRRPALVVALLAAASLLLAGCGGFWDWLAGRPITRPAPAPAAVDDGGGEAAPGRPGGGDDGGSATAPGAGTGAGSEEEAGAGDPAGDPDPTAGDEFVDGDILPDRCSLWSAGLEPSPGPFERITLEPVDEAGKEPSFAEFRASLLAALERRDLAALEAVVHPEIRTDFSGETGLADFRRQWGLDQDPEASPLWDVLTDLLNLGGVMTGGGGDEPRRFWAPYVYALYNASLDPFGHAVVTGAGVNVRAEPSLDAEILDQASHLVVRVLQAEEELPRLELGGRVYC